MKFFNYERDSYLWLRPVLHRLNLHYRIENPTRRHTEYKAELIETDQPVYILVSN